MNPDIAFAAELPFKSLVNFGKLFEFWEDQMVNGTEVERDHSKYVLDKLKKVPALRKPFEGTDMIEQHPEEVELLFSCLFPKALQENEIKSATLPFHRYFFNPTKRFQRILKNAGDPDAVVFRNMDDIYFMAASFVLSVAYEVNLNHSNPMIFDIPDTTTGIIRTYRAFFNADFSELRFTDRSPDLSDEDIRRLLDNVNDLDLWKQMIPPDSFEIHGFGLLTIFDITADDALSSIKYDLINHNALLDDSKLQNIETSLRKIFGVPDLKMGLSIIDDDKIISIGKMRCNSLLLSGKEVRQRKEFFCSGSEETLLKLRQPMAVSDLSLMPADESTFMDAIRASGAKSYMISPLTYDGRVIGLLELGSETPRALHSVAQKKMESIIPLFSAALQRSVDDYLTNLEAIIKEKCTAIHPSVEWRFYDAAMRVYKSGRKRSEVEMEEILFENVHPLYGQMDISGSSKSRDKGIQQDLLTQLKLAKNVLLAAKKEGDLMIYDQLIQSINHHAFRLEESLNAGDESSMLDFFKNEIDPVFTYLEAEGKASKALKNYKDRIDEKINMVYEYRKDYEETVSLINDQISMHLENAQGKAQEMFPHYFEKYKTDGVEYNIYIGDSLVRDQNYHPMYLKNLRIWQLMVTCEIENELQKLRPQFKVDLEIASLILVQEKSLEIRFKMDEKQFDVDGAYNARYEIIKKRVDKARLKGRTERLTQPGKIAIVYSSDNELKEYQQHLTYLINRKYLMPNIEYLELEELQGASGLRALRVSVNFDRSEDDALEKEVQALISTVE